MRRSIGITTRKFGGPRNDPVRASEVTMTTMTRAEWLNAMAGLLVPMFDRTGYSIVRALKRYEICWSESGMLESTVTLPGSLTDPLLVTDPDFIGVCDWDGRPPRIWVSAETLAARRGNPAL